MQLKICKQCGRMFEALTSSDVCPKCLLDSKEAFERVRAYLREYPGTPITIVSEETGIPIYAIENFLRHERIEISPDSPVMLACNKCGKLINTGLYCDECSKSIRADLQKIKNSILADEKEQAESSGMHGRMRYVQASDYRNKKK